LSAESYVNPFAPEPTTESGKKKISRRKRRSFPSAWVGAKSGPPVSKYLSEFSELGVRCWLCFSFANLEVALTPRVDGS
jgi:hypothetical protein